MGSPLMSQVRSNVIIDGRMVFETPHGIARYVTQLAQALRILREKNQLTYEPIFLIHSPERRSLFSPFQTCVARSPFLSPWEILEIPSLLKKLKADLYHSPSFSSLWNCPCPSVVTIHDLNHLSFGSLSKKIYYSTLLRHFARSSKVISTVSEFSQKEISHWLGISPSKIEVVYNVIEEPVTRTSEESQVVLKRHGLTIGKYFFCFFNSKPHKNLETLITAYQRYLQQCRNPWPLVLTGNRVDSNPNIRSLGDLPDQEIQVILAQSAGMLFPSRYEGFGLPPLEAVVSKVRLAVSRIPPHEESLIDLSPFEALWIPPADIHGWTGAFHKIQSGELSPPLLETGKKILSRYSLERMSHQVDQIYRRVLNRTQ
jgi:hypothetical protein